VRGRFPPRGIPGTGSRGRLPAVLRAGPASTGTSIRTLDRPCRNRTSGRSAGTARDLPPAKRNQTSSWRKCETGFGDADHIATSRASAEGGSQITLNFGQDRRPKTPEPRLPSALRTVVCAVREEVCAGREGTCRNPCCSAPVLYNSPLFQLSCA
jgi:hypothetical protein